MTIEILLEAVKTGATMALAALAFVGWLIWPCLLSDHLDGTRWAKPIFWLGIFNIAFSIAMLFVMAAMYNSGQLS